MSRAWASIEPGTGLKHDGFGDVDAEGARAVAAGPREDSCVLGFVPQIGLENRQAFEWGQVFGEQTPFVVRVIPRRRRAAQVGKALTDPVPKIPVRGPRRQGCSPRTVQFHVPSANDNGRWSPLLITSPATVGGSAG